MNNQLTMETLQTRIEFLTRKLSLFVPLELLQCNEHSQLDFSTFSSTQLKNIVIFKEKKNMQKKTKQELIQWLSGKEEEDDLKKMSKKKLREMATFYSIPALKKKKQQLIEEIEKEREKEKEVKEREMDEEKEQENFSEEKVQEDKIQEDKIQEEKIQEEKYMSLTMEMLKRLALNRELDFEDDITKEELVKLLSVIPFDEMSLPDWRSIAKELKLKGYSSNSKKELKIKVEPFIFK